MRTGRVPGLDRPVSRIVLGTALLDTARPEQAFSTMDAYAESGGNCLDTAWIYGNNGSSESIVGQWLTRTGTRDQTVVVGKGACSRNCRPEDIQIDLAASLDRLQTDHVDIYLMHRDNPDVPVGEFVDALNALVGNGQASVFGGSNWTPARIEEANSYAAAHGLLGFSASSPNFSLAVWNEPTWEDTVTAADPHSRAWYARHPEVALFAWSSQAAGFFTGRYGEWSYDDPTAADVVRVWFSESNLERLSRAREVGLRRGVDANQVALAYVLAQPFTVFALIGPLSAEEARASLRADHIHLTPDELSYLNLDDEAAASSLDRSPAGQATASTSDRDPQ